MDFTFNINVIFRRDITVLDNRLMLFSQKCRHGQNSGEAYKQVCSVIDKMGHASAKAQGLGGVITTARKLEFSDHRLYVMKEADSNDGKGAIVGIMKVGPKRLFVYDRQGNQHEVDAQCVLDFYVHESRQRSGYGKKIFEFMVQTEALKPQHLAIDRPSPKFSAFLAKHYNLKAAIPQLNNFAVFDGFFKERPANKAASKGKLHLYNKPTPNAVLHNPAIEALWNAPDSGRQSSLSNSNVPLTDLEKEKEILKDIQIPRSDSQDNITSISKGQLQRSSSLNWELSNLVIDEKRGYAAQGSRYSRYESATPPRPDSGQRVTSASKLGQGQAGSPAAQNTTAITSKKESSPPLLRRDGPSQDYLSQTSPINAHRDYHSRQGHLRVTPGGVGAPVSTMSQHQRPSPLLEGAGDAPKNSPIGGAQVNPVAAGLTPQQGDFKNDSLWHVNSNNHSAKKYQRTRLW